MLEINEGIILWENSCNACPILASFLLSTYLGCPFNMERVRDNYTTCSFGFWMSMILGHPIRAYILFFDF